MNRNEEDVLLSGCEEQQERRKLSGVKSSSRIRDSESIVALFSIFIK